jgi:hypothetical protein
MTLHLVKLCVGADSIEDLASWQKERLAAQKKAGKRPRIHHATFQTPKREADLLDGGSLYWVIKGIVQARQRILALEEGTREDGTRCCHIVLDQRIVPVRPVPRRAFQGWRYLEPDEAPADLTGNRGAGVAEMPPAMRKKLAELGLL